ncbi:hypothetical protein M0R45_000310 [Rubus argutus]|uniref:Uncharacterized protein n=1 Tax=Rubus argutus TaxID=59490 RepID=A0AAW1VNQ3_RUBAR
MFRPPRAHAQFIPSHRCNFFSTASFLSLPSAAARPSPPITHHRTTKATQSPRPHLLPPVTNPTLLCRRFHHAQPPLHLCRAPLHSIRRSQNATAHWRPKLCRCCVVPSRARARPKMLSPLPSSAMPSAPS